jgi:hypothetical protein
VLEEGGLLLQHLAEHLREHRDFTGTDRLATQALEVRRQSEAVRQIVAEREGLSIP